jgi:hypothetical protein
MSPASLARFLGGRARATVASCFSSVGTWSRWQEEGRGQQSVLTLYGAQDQPRAAGWRAGCSAVGMTAKGVGCDDLWVPDIGMS